MFGIYPHEGSTEQITLHDWSCNHYYTSSYKVEHEAVGDYAHPGGETRVYFHNNDAFIIGFEWHTGIIRGGMRLFSGMKDSVLMVGVNLWNEEEPDSEVGSMSVPSVAEFMAYVNSL